MDPKIRSESTKSTSAGGVPVKNEKLSDAPHFRQCITVKGSPEKIYAFWRDFKNLPLFMKNVTSVSVLSPKKSHWVVDLPKGPTVEWDAEIIAERSGEMISWQSIGDSSVQQAGSVWFRPAPREMGTIVSLSLSYHIPGGKLVELATKLLGEDPETLALKNLRQFKAYMETGEVPTVEGQPSGRDEDYRKNETH